LIKHGVISYFCDVSVLLFLFCNGEANEQHRRAVKPASRTR
jgi:hypothetical protein